MSSGESNFGTELRFFATPGHACSYLPDKEATTLFLDPEAQVDQPLYSRLSVLGFRRSGSHLYRPYCEGCDECVPVRLPVASFRPKRIQRRIWRDNQDLELSLEEPRFSDELYDLYARYITARHPDGDMFPPLEEQFRSFLVEGLGTTRYLEFRLQGKLLSVAVADRLDNGLSAIYTFFEPNEQKRSLGVYAVLRLIEACREQGLPYLYLGYWIEQCAKMSYKLDYRPTEILLRGSWHEVE